MSILLTLKHQQRLQRNSSGSIVSPRSGTQAQMLAQLHIWQRVGGVCRLILVLLCWP